MNSHWRHIRTSVLGYEALFARLLRRLLQGPCLLLLLSTLLLTPSYSQAADDPAENQAAAANVAQPTADYQPLHRLLAHLVGLERALALVTLVTKHGKFLSLDNPLLTEKHTNQLLDLRSALTRGVLWLRSHPPADWDPEEIRKRANHWYEATALMHKDVEPFLELLQDELYRMLDARLNPHDYTVNPLRQAVTFWFEFGTDYADRFAVPDPANEPGPLVERYAPVAKHLRRFELALGTLLDFLHLTVVSDQQEPLLPAAAAVEELNTALTDLQKQLETVTDSNDPRLASATDSADRRLLAFSRQLATAELPSNSTDASATSIAQLAQLQSTTYDCLLGLKGDLQPQLAPATALFLIDDIVALAEDLGYLFSMTIPPTQQRLQRLLHFLEQIYDPATIPTLEALLGFSTESAAATTLADRRSWYQRYIATNVAEETPLPAYHRLQHLWSSDQTQLRFISELHQAFTDLTTDTPRAAYFYDLNNFAGAPSQRNQQVLATTSVPPELSFKEPAAYYLAWFASGDGAKNKAAYHLRQALRTLPLEAYPGGSFDAFSEAIGLAAIPGVHVDYFGYWSPGESLALPMIAFDFALPIIVPDGEIAQWVEDLSTNNPDSLYNLRTSHLSLQPWQVDVLALLYLVGRIEEPDKPPLRTEHQVIVDLKKVIAELQLRSSLVGEPTTEPRFTTSHSPADGLLFKLHAGATGRQAAGNLLAGDQALAAYAPGMHIFPDLVRQHFNDNTVDSERVLAAALAALTKLRAKIGNTPSLQRFTARAKRISVRRMR